jgi:DNA-binding transcriptional regulator YiaG
MTRCAICGGADAIVRVVPSYEANLLGAPFSVVLESSVREETCASCGNKVATVIPDLEGLLQAVAVTRALVPRKLNGGEIKFLRSAMGWKAKHLARHLELGAEHLSRCENGSKTLSPLAEKWFRLFVIVKVLEKSVKKRIDLDALKDRVDIEKLFDMKIEPTWNPSDALRLHFRHRKEQEPERDLFVDAPDGVQPDGKWEPEQLKAA